VDDPVGDGVSGTKYEDDVRVMDGTEDTIVSMDNGEFRVLADGEVRDRMSKLMDHVGSESLRCRRATR